ncbi:MAG: hypothetical protein K0U20_09095 [Proteobacteria bacterium]|nr:hypothetical protein [Pseudomonadota bacterium]
MSNENKVDIKSAEVEFERFVEAMDLDVDTADMDTEDLTAFKKTKNRLIRAIQKGSLVFNEDGEAVYTPVNAKSKHTEAITFHERTGASLMAMDSKKKGHDVAKTYAVLGNMTGLHQSTFAGLVGIDVKICEAIFALLMD